jgi:glycerol-3-phosphate dehydrogenase (NAD(P)+)
VEPAKVAVVGAGTWGTVIATLLAPAGPSARRVVLAARQPARAEELRRLRQNSAYLPGFELPASLEVTSSLADAVQEADVVVMAVPSKWARPAMAAVSAHRATEAVVLSVAKGLEPGSSMTMSQVGAEEMPGATFAVLNGPNFAGEIAAGLPAATVVACAERAAATALQALFTSSRFRVYTNDDVVGCELAGAVKNVLALAAGIVEGMGLGDNARAAMMTRGLAEMTRLGVAMGGHPLTFSGLAGLGDLVLTCTSDRSRNRRVGLALGRGRPLREVVAGMNQVAEGVSTAQPVVDLAARHGLEMPICAQVAAVLAGSSTPARAIDALLARDQTHELAGAPTWPGRAGGGW